MMKSVKFFLLIIISYPLHAQYAPNNYPTSPDVNKIQTYGEISTSPYAGLTNITLPIYTIKEGDFQFPISLDYNSRGIKVREEASRVGIGWSLGLPGLISRTINGLDDFLGDFNSRVSVMDRGKYFYSRANDNTLVPDFTGYVIEPFIMKMGLDTRIMPNDYQLDNYLDPGSRETKQNTDFQPDVFSYKLPNYNGKFIFKRNRQPILEKLQDNLKIEILDSLNIGRDYTVKMKIIDDKGNTYFFNDYERLIYQGSHLISTDNAWYISKIVTSKGDIIKFTYENTETFPGYNLLDYHGMPINLYNDCTNGTESCGNFPFSESKVYEGMKFFKSKLIKKIEFSQGILEFEYSNREDIYQDKKISQIIIKNVNEKLVKSIKLNHDYFVTNFSTLNTSLGDWQQNMESYADREKYLNHRLRLESLDFMNSEQEVINSQIFEYFNENIPTKNSTAMDLWGYFNGAKNNQHLFPDFTIIVPNAQSSRPHVSMMSYNWGENTTLHIAGANRDVNPLYTNTMLLKKIIYPTKGKTEFEYENNTYDPSESFKKDQNASKISFFQERDDNSFRFAGGLRIKSVVNNDMIGGNYYTEFKYHDSIDSDHSNGLLIERPNLFDFRKRRTAIYIPGSEYDPNGLNGLVLLRNIPKYDEDFIGYKYVTEMKYSSSIFSKKIYHYYIEGSWVYTYLYSLGKGFDVPKNSLTENENIFYKTTIKSNSFHLMPYDQRNMNSWLYRDYSFDYKPSEIENEKNPYNGLLKKIELFDENDYKIRSESFQYNLVTIPIQYWGVIYGLTDKEAGPLTSDMWADFRYHNPYYFTLYPLIQSMAITKGHSEAQYNIAYKSIKSINNPGPEKIIIKDYLNNKVLTTTVDNIYRTVTGTSYLLSNKTIFPDLSTKVIDYQYAEEKSNLYLLNKNMISIPLESTITKKQHVGDAGKIIFKVETKYPASQIEANTRTSGLPVPYEVWSKDLQNSNLNKEITYDSYDNKGNLLQYTTKAGVSTSIIWGYSQTQPIAKIEGAKLSQITQTLINSIVNASDETNANYSESTLVNQLDAFRIALPNFQISTYTYKPLIGVTTITPPSGIRELYIYDTANRLKEVKDINGDILKTYEYHYKP